MIGRALVPVLLAAAPASTGPVNQAPAYREIPEVIYNLLPAELIAALGGPPQPVPAPVPLPSDGEAAILVLGGALAAPTGPRVLPVAEIRFIPRAQPLTEAERRPGS